MKKLVATTFILVLIGCNMQKKQSLEEMIKENDLRDSITTSFKAKIQKEIQDESILTDTLGMHASPVIVEKAVLVPSSSGSYRNVQLKFKNITDKTVVGIKFGWRGKNAFLEPADLGSSFVKGYGGGWTDQALSPGKTRFSTWEILSRDAKTIEAVWVTEVIFSDNTKWLQKDFKQ